jgi:hypothetical protein
MKKLTKGPAVATVSVCNKGYATSVASGILVPDACLALATASADAAATSGARGLTYRLEHVVVACVLHELPQHDAFTAAGQAIPAVFVVTPEHMTMFVEYCRRAGRGGMIRRAFTDAERARDWLWHQAWMMDRTMRFRNDRARHTRPCTPDETACDPR